MDLDGTLTQDPQRLAEAFNNYFIDSVAVLAQNFPNSHLAPVSEIVTEKIFEIREL